MSLISIFFETVSFHQLILALIAFGVVERGLYQAGINPWSVMRQR